MYALRNALIPGISVSAVLLTSAVRVEITFSISGIGTTLVGFAASKDVPLVHGVAMLISRARRMV